VENIIFKAYLKKYRFLSRILKGTPNMIRFAFLPWIIWTIGLFTFWPGMMSRDSLVQWSQIQSGGFYDLQPAFHTLLMWFITFFCNSPSTIVFVQIITLGLVVGWLLSSIQKKLQIPIKWIWIASIISAISPINLVLVNTLWKDVFYTTVVIAITTIFFNISTNNSNWFKSKKNIFSLSLLLAMAFLLRWNGLSVTVGCLISLVVFYKKDIKNIVILSLITLLMILFVRGPLFNQLKIESSDWFFYTLPIHHMGAFLNADIYFSNDEEEFLDKVSPISNNWEYECGKNIQKAFGTNLGIDLIYDKDYFLENKSKFMQIYFSKVKNNPSVLFNHILCSSAFIWNPNAWMKSKMQLKTLGGTRWIPTPNKYNIHSNSKIQNFVAPLTKYIKFSIPVWRPALYLYLLFFLTLWMFFYQDNKILALVFIPIFCHCLGLAIVSITPEFRFQFPVIVFSQIIWVILFKTNISNKI
tara:strand:+ start:12573 stop:13979 length:1407 start_codon:yes stop_codon:yes gene_type:complete